MCCKLLVPLDNDMTSFPYEANTDGIIVRVRPSWLGSESNPSQGRYIWAYQIEIENTAKLDWTLRRRHWKIIDANGQTQTVDGDGVVGQTPALAPGDVFRYTSGVPLTAPSGLMSGYFELENVVGGLMQAQVPTFSLDSPYERSQPS